MFFETKNLCFSYYKSPLSLKDVNLSFQRNAKVMVLASKDLGKTTLLKVLSGFESSRFGNIYLNGKELKMIDDKDKNFSLVLAEPVLFENKTVKQNLCFQLELIEKMVDNESLTKILEEYGLNVGLNQKIKKLTLVQKRLLQIVRAMLKNPQILFIDDLFEGLENEDLLKVLQVYKKLFDNKNLTIVSTIGDETYKNLRLDFNNFKLDKVIYLNLAEIKEFKSLKLFEESYVSLDALNFLIDVKLSYRTIEKEANFYSLLNGEFIQFKFDDCFKNSLDLLKLDFAEMEECVILLLENKELDNLNETEFNDLLKNKQCFIFSNLTGNRII